MTPVSFATGTGAALRNQPLLSGCLSFFGDSGAGAASTKGLWSGASSRRVCSSSARPAIIGAATWPAAFSCSKVASSTSPVCWLTLMSSIAWAKVCVSRYPRRALSASAHTLASWSRGSPLRSKNFTASGPVRRPSASASAAWNQVANIFLSSLCERALPSGVAPIASMVAPRLYAEYGAAQALQTYTLSMDSGKELGNVFCPARISRAHCLLISIMRSESV
mmetsp:Transcript_2243/g.6669  ORF Transcript_2243/g.6669 Transcript_2243/m.6669 type:complete len:222 (-) Transcript_2243:113-778(-)